VPGKWAGIRRWPVFWSVIGKAYMEHLKTEPIRIKAGEEAQEYLIQEKDYGDQIVYDIYRKDRYLMTLGRDGSILFLNFEADPEDKEIFKLSHLNRFVEKIQAVS
jgi:hypothetical protein